MVLGKFQYLAARTLDQAAKKNSERQGSRHSRGDNLVGVLKDRVHEKYPETLVDLKTIPGLAYFKEDKKALRIGALTTLSAIANNQRIQELLPALTEAARMVASPQIRTREPSAAISARSPGAGITAPRITSFIVSGKGNAMRSPAGGTIAIIPFLVECELPLRRARHPARAMLT